MNNCQSALDDLKDIVEGISKLRDAAYVKYSELVRQVLENQITDEQQWMYVARHRGPMVRSSWQIGLPTSGGHEGILF